jgi:small conductance mechanosensitive channel
MKMWDSVIGVIADFTLEKSIRLIGALIILTVGFKLIKFITVNISKGKFYGKLEPTVQNFIRIIIDYTLKIILMITVASVLGVPMTSMLALLGSAALAIGLALQGSLSNIAGSFIIFVFRPFVVGDFIIAEKYSGTVRDISVFYTTILTIDNKRTLIPNSIITNEIITDVSSMPTRRIDLKFPAAYNTDVDKIKNILVDTAASNEFVLDNPAPVSVLEELSDNSMIFTLRLWCKNPDYWKVYYDTIENVKKAFDKNNIKIPYRQLDVHLENDNKTDAKRL